MTHEEFLNAVGSETLQFVGIDNGTLIFEYSGKLYAIWVRTKPIDLSKISYDTSGWLSYHAIDLYHGVKEVVFRNRHNEIVYENQF